MSHRDEKIAHTVSQRYCIVVLVDILEILLYRDLEAVH